MNRYLALGCLGLGLMVSPLLSGLSTGAVPAPKIGVIDLDNTLSSTPAGKRANDAFEKTRKAKQSELDKAQQDLKAADAELINMQQFDPTTFTVLETSPFKSMEDLVKQVKDNPDTVTWGSPPTGSAAMIGKIIVHGDTREQALARMRTALSETVIEGINTNVPLHRELMVDAKFMAGGTNIHYLEEWLSHHKR